MTVTLYTALQVEIGTTVTDSAGGYSFGGLAADSYDAYVSDQNNCLYGYGSATVALGELHTVDISAGCF